MNSSNETTKMPYVPPVVVCETISMEGTLAASSATIIPGGAKDPFSPEIADWEMEVKENSILL